jgi:hypothetical protein
VGAVAGPPVRIETERLVLRKSVAKLGFTEVGRFEQHGAEQWLGRWSPVPSSG